MTSEDWPVITATVEGCYWEESPSRIPSPLFVGHFNVAFSHIVDGSHYRGKFCSSYQLADGAELAVRYNPQNPKESSACDDDESQSDVAMKWVFGFLEGFDL